MYGFERVAGHDAVHKRCQCIVVSPMFSLQRTRHLMLSNDFHRIMQTTHYSHAVLHLAQSSLLLHFGLVFTHFPCNATHIKQSNSQHILHITVTHYPRFTRMCNRKKVHHYTLCMAQNFPCYTF